MKIPLLFISILSVNLTACATPPAAKMTVKVLDEETSAPMSNCFVRTRFLVKSHWNDPDEYDEQKCISDADGICVFRGIDDSFGYGGGVLSSNYYSSSFKMPYTGVNRILNRWEPWNPTIEVKMRKIKKPVPMIHRSVRIKRIPELNKQVGFDLEISDWVAPYGKGIVSDFIFNATWFFQEPQRGSDGRYALSFSNETDGIQTYHFAKETSSIFKWPYKAPVSGYQPILKKHISWPANGGERETNYDDANNYIFRVRSKKLSDGSIVGTYGIIQREIEVGPKGSLQFEYWFNPDSSSRSLEYNGENLLKK